MNYKVQIRVELTHEIEVSASSESMARTKVEKMLKAGQLPYSQFDDESIEIDATKIDDGIWSEPLPEWAMCYVFNGDKEGLSDEEIKMIDDWMEEKRILHISPPDDDEESYFTSSPPFGLACNVYDCDVIYKDDPLDRNGKPIVRFAKVKWYDPDIEHRDLDRIWTVEKVSDEIIYLYGWYYGVYSELEAPPSELEIIE